MGVVGLFCLWYLGVVWCAYVLRLASAFVLWVYALRVLLANTVKRALLERVAVNPVIEVVEVLCSGHWGVKIE